VNDPEHVVTNGRIAVWPSSKRALQLLSSDLSDIFRRRVTQSEALSMAIQGFRKHVMTAGYPEAEPGSAPSEYGCLACQAPAQLIGRTFSGNPAYRCGKCKTIFDIGLLSAESTCPGGC
jgi:hypothetical protein